MNQKHQIAIAKLFGMDHAERFNLWDSVVSITDNGRMLIDLTDDELNNLREDAEFYADPMMGYASEGYASLVKSAKAVLRVLDKQAALLGR